MRDSVRAESIQCFFCKHLTDEGAGSNTFYCRAYPSGIPEDIIKGVRKHDKVFDDQRGEIVFEKIEDIA